MKPPKPDSERAIQKQVVLFLRERRWWVQIFSTSTMAGSGLQGHPDIMAMRVRQEDGALCLLYVECKAKGAGLRPSQEKWLQRAQRIIGSGNVGYYIATAPDFEGWLTYYNKVLESFHLEDHV